MDLRTYLFMNRLRVDQLAKKLKVTPQYLSLISNGKQKPSLQLAIKLVRASKGEISPEDIYPELFDEYKRSPKAKKETKNKEQDKKIPLAGLTHLGEI